MWLLAKKWNLTQPNIFLLLGTNNVHCAAQDTEQRQSLPWRYNLEMKWRRWNGLRSHKNTYLLLVCLPVIEALLYRQKQTFTTWTLRRQHRHGRVSKTVFFLMHQKQKRQLTSDCRSLLWMLMKENEPSLTLRAQGELSGPSGRTINIIWLVNGALLT